ncbi:transmembrane and death domain protein 1 [Brachyhypopomus gauderio]|uniref:transmembrane and death domain protein 1 n=1 Tax=Brachyhypopomus gauderio TaxID=698409 RepID=UPI00404107A4
MASCSEVLGLFFSIYLPLLATPSLGDDTVAEDVGRHQLQRLVDLLTVHECEELLLALSRPEENIFKQLERLSAEHNRLGLPPRTRRSVDKETHCHPALTVWLQTHGMETYYDRLSRALQQIGRTDIAIEVDKNINQDKMLGLQRYVDAYDRRRHEDASHLRRSRPEEDRPAETPQRSARKVRALTWKDLDLVVERYPVPPYKRRLLDGAWPLLSGLLLGFGGAFFVGVVILLVTIRISLHDQHEVPRLSARPKHKAQTRRHHGRRGPRDSSTLGVSAEESPVQQTTSPSDAAALSQLY